MPGHYSTRCRSRPHPQSSGSKITTLRLFVCVSCRAQVLVCSHCDHGQIYCAGTCAQVARHNAQRAAGRRYQTSYRGRIKHAARNSRYRARQKIVTHQGSPPRSQNDDVPLTANHRAAASRDVVMQSQAPGPEYSCCHWCEHRWARAVRIGFLRRRRRGSSHGRNQGEPHDDLVRS
jgi:hypothetical protein